MIAYILIALNIPEIEINEEKHKIKYFLSKSSTFQADKEAYLLLV
jgi:hypothetical protein